MTDLIRTPEDIAADLKAGLARLARLAQRRPKAEPQQKRTLSRQQRRAMARIDNVTGRD